MDIASLSSRLRFVLDSDLIKSTKILFESTLFQSPEPPTGPPTIWQLIFDPPLPYLFVALTNLCRLASAMILLPLFVVGLLDFAGYAVFRTLGLHRQRIRISTSKGGTSRPPLYSKRKPKIYTTDRGRPTDNSIIPSIVKAPLLSPGTYDAETLLKHRALSLNGESKEQEAAWLSSGGYFARVSVVKSETSSTEASLVSPGSDVGLDPSRAEIARTHGVGVDGALGLVDTDLDESGTESGSNSPVQRFSSLKAGCVGSGGSGSCLLHRRRGLSGGLNFTPVYTDGQLKNPQDVESFPVSNFSITTQITTTTTTAAAATTIATTTTTMTTPSILNSDSAERLSASISNLSSPSSDQPSSHASTAILDDGTSCSTSNSSWIGIEDQEAIQAANAAADLEP